MRAKREIVGAQRTWADGLLVDLAAAVRDVDDGDVIALTSARADVAEGLEAWSRMTGHAIVAREDAPDGHRWMIRKGSADVGAEPPRPIGSRLWLYSNFDCNLQCDYCCVRSSPKTPRRELGLERVRRIASEASACGVDSILVTGGEPFLLADIAEIITTCAEVAPTTVLTNAMLFTGSRLERLRSLPRERVVLQVSVDSPTSELHDLHRGKGSWDKAMRGVTLAREEGFRVRLAATVSTAADEQRFREFLDREGIDEDDRVIRRVAMRGFATDGVPLSSNDLVPEVTLTGTGVYWHPVGADDDDFLVTTEMFPLADAIAAVRARWEEIRAHDDTVASIFHCA
ncbi:MAG: radical SAM protein [Myxococcales bacterium]|nr:radical SAM protein [Myxococcales bacterium]